MTSSTTQLILSHPRLCLTIETGERESDLVHSDETEEGGVFSWLESGESGLEIATDVKARVRSCGFDLRVRDEHTEKERGRMGNREDTCYNVFSCELGAFWCKAIKCYL